ncbi:4-hydroxy-tetrahydrodipicolinate reductase [Hoeflea sp. WL0058]|uniref:4-hydroxy-tetrahydrodipicolinate reductase n=1 Tax=Flavimaribacter sediminis TaxID=2865987 RepID=A0AAE2ZLK4_9HYPH|nr:4-hydroxy-tetrahydrodipicolinate reductase [Flavimaribacter sediminis]MBW8638219.1 4-hydroxy-tetrahydrodipicolinate reductase [Flavimaribacter sediminis]
MSDMRLAVAGAAGRMGQALIRAIASMDGVVVSAAIERSGSDILGRDAGVQAQLGEIGVAFTDDFEAAMAVSDGLVDFTAPDVSVANAGLAAQYGLVHIIGTTGCDAAHEEKIRKAAEKAIIVKSGNMSLGVNLLSVLVRQAAKALDPQDWDIEIVEMHHRHKVDAPSGTALLLGQAAAEGRDIDLDAASIRVRDGHTGPRPAGSIGFATLRGGSVVGEHTVMLAGEGELVELSHKATDRSIFARGAVKAALWARNREPGLYSMIDVLGLSEN